MNKGHCPIGKGAMTLSVMQDGAICLQHNAFITTNIGSVQTALLEISQREFSRRKFYLTLMFSPFIY